MLYTCNTLKTSGMYYRCGTTGHVFRISPAISHHSNKLLHGFWLRTLHIPFLHLIYIYLLYYPKLTLFSLWFDPTLYCLMIRIYIYILLWLSALCRQAYTGFILKYNHIDMNIYSILPACIIFKLYHVFDMAYLWNQYNPDM